MWNAMKEMTLERNMKRNERNEMKVAENVSNLIWKLIRASSVWKSLLTLQCTGLSDLCHLCLCWEGCLVHYLLLYGLSSVLRRADTAFTLFSLILSCASSPCSWPDCCLTLTERRLQKLCSLHVLPREKQRGSPAISTCHRTAVLATIFSTISAETLTLAAQRNILRTASAWPSAAAAAAATPFLLRCRPFPAQLRLKLIENNWRAWRNSASAAWTSLSWLDTPLSSPSAKENINW